MKVKYVGRTIGLGGLTDGKIYEVVEVDELTGALRIIDDDPNDINDLNDPDWKPGYLYSPTSPSPLTSEEAWGHFVIIEDDENGSLNKAING